jgi:hypothetical protein
MTAQVREATTKKKLPLDKAMIALGVSFEKAGGDVGTETL